MIYNGGMKRCIILLTALSSSLISCAHVISEPHRIEAVKELPTSVLFKDPEAYR
jgi:hypothetical protein